MPLTGLRLRIFHLLDDFTHRMEQPAPETPTLEQSIQRLEQIVLELERGELELESALEQYEEGIAIARRCLEQLKAAELKIEELSGFDDE